MIAAWVTNQIEPVTACAAKEDIQPASLRAAKPTSWRRSTRAPTQSKTVRTWSLLCTSERRFSRCSSLANCCARVVASAAKDSGQKDRWSHQDNRDDNYRDGSGQIGL